MIEAQGFMSSFLESTTSFDVSTCISWNWELRIKWYTLIKENANVVFFFLQREIES